MTVKTVEPSLFASIDPMILRGSACQSCDAHIFPAINSCPVCLDVDVRWVELPTQGTVWSWTTQHVAPKPPFRTDHFNPFSLGYIDLGPVIVEGWLVGKIRWVIGEPVRLVAAKAWTENGHDVYTFGFEAVP